MQTGTKTGKRAAQGARGYSVLLMRGYECIANILHAPDWKTAQMIAQNAAASAVQAGYPNATTHVVAL